MTLGKYEQLVDRLLTKTEAGEILWKETAEPATFQVPFPNYSITISYRKELLPAVIVTILNSEGKSVDSFTQFDLRDEHAGKLSKLYENARRKALGAEKALDEILSELGGAR